MRHLVTALALALAACGGPADPMPRWGCDTTPSGTCCEYVGAPEATGDAPALWSCWPGRECTGPEGPGPGGYCVGPDGVR